ncbi:MAG: nucleotidyltransferase [Acidobacteriota bacterium]|nr:nucleotidyltransferase [Acidobacteriota bacterium]
MIDQLQTVFASFQKNDVRYLVIGGIAAVLYGVPRATFDLDILIQPTKQNAQNLLEALAQLNFGTADMITADELVDTEITIFTDRVRLDVQTSTPGILFDEAWPRRVKMSYKGQVFDVVSLADLIKSKTAAGREIDLEDVRLLKLVQKESNSED